MSDATAASTSDAEVAVIITGGGTAGHTNPGIATAQALVRAGLEQSAVHFVGGERGNERSIVPEAGFSIDLLPGRGIKRSLSLDNIGAITDLVRGAVEAFRIVRTRRPAVVLCLGGYAAFGASLAAILQRVPVVVTEQNARASAVNRVIGRFARSCAIPFPGTDLPNAVLTGNPVRPAVVDAVVAADRSASRVRKAFPDDRVVIAVWSGSLGARSVNRAVRDLADRWRDRADVTIHHVIGRRDWDEFAEPDWAGSLDYRTIEFEDDMPTLLVGADLAICRSGASTVTELAVAGLPAVLVPLPGAPRDHQRANSTELAEAGGAVVVDDGELSAERLIELLDPLVTERSRRDEMRAAASSVGRPEAAAAVAELVAQVGGIELPALQDSATQQTRAQASNDRESS